MAALKLGTLIDRHYKANQEVAKKKRLVVKAEQEVKRAQGKANKLEQDIRDRFKRGEIDGATGKVAKAELRTLTSAQISNWAKLAKYAIANNAIDLFQRRVNKAAWVERLAERKNRPIPGIKKYDRVVLSTTKKR